MSLALTNSKGARVQPANLSAHLQRDQYGDFLLTEAVRPSVDLQILPRQGYRVQTIREQKMVARMLAAAISREKLFETFLAMLEPLGPVVDVVLESSHEAKDEEDFKDLWREGIDLPVLMSYFCEHEDLLLNDGCTGLAVLNPKRTQEVVWDEHKLLFVHGPKLQTFRRILEENGIHRDDQLRFITEAEHLHSTHPRYKREFEQLCFHVGVGEPAEHVNW
jgi:hypothetical protein